MKGSTHLSIGVAIGAAAAAHYPFSIQNASIYLAVAALSALSADLDGPSILSRKIGKAAKRIHNLSMWLGVCCVAGAIYLYGASGSLSQEAIVLTVVMLLLGFVAKVGLIRNIIISCVGGAMLIGGVLLGWGWLIGLGIFVAWVPWLNHRGFSHTIWAALLWGAIGWGLEQHLELEGIALVSLLGYGSHLVADTLTPRGVKWFYPLYKRSIKLRL